MSWRIRGGRPSRSSWSTICSRWPLVCGRCSTRRRLWLVVVGLGRRPCRLLVKSRQPRRRRVSRRLRIVCCLVLLSSTRAGLVLGDLSHDGRRLVWNLWVLRLGRVLIGLSPRCVILRRSARRHRSRVTARKGSSTARWLRGPESWVWTAPPCLIVRFARRSPGLRLGWVAPRTGDTGGRPSYVASVLDLLWRMHGRRRARAFHLVSVVEILIPRFGIWHRRRRIGVHIGILRSTGNGSIPECMLGICTGKTFFQHSIVVPDNGREFGMKVQQGICIRNCSANVVSPGISTHRACSWSRHSSEPVSVEERRCSRKAPGFAVLEGSYRVVDAAIDRPGSQKGGCSRPQQG